MVTQVQVEQAAIQVLQEQVVIQVQAELQAIVVLQETVVLQVQVETLVQVVHLAIQVQVELQE